MVADEAAERVHTLDAVDVLIFRRDTIHAGAAYDTENIRVHASLRNTKTDHSQININTYLVPVLEEQLPSLAMSVANGRCQLHNFTVSVQVNLRPRLRRWLEWRLSVWRLGGGVGLNNDKRDRRLLRAMTDCCTDAKQELRARCSHFPGLIVDETEFAFMDEIIASVRARLGPFALETNRHPERCLPLLFDMLHDLEVKNKAVHDRATQPDGSTPTNKHHKFGFEFKLFTLLPQKRRHHHRAASNRQRIERERVPRDYPELWRYYFSVDRVIRSTTTSVTTSPQMELLCQCCSRRRCLQLPSVVITQQRELRPLHLSVVTAARAMRPYNPA